MPDLALKCYALLYTKYGTREFSGNSLSWFLSAPMRRKIFHVLAKRRWLERTGRDRYRCIPPGKVLREMFQFKVFEKMKKAKRPWCFTKASAVEIWTDFSYVQRSWEYSPYFIKILKRDLPYWKNFLRSNDISFFVQGAGSAMGEFVVLEPVNRLEWEIRHGFPVDRLKNVVKFCVNRATFEYPLAYLALKYKMKIKVDPRVMEKVAEAL
ncbi:MAG: hypothetical protein QXH26_04190 [Candidatus Hadarchaeales archaeon]